MSYPKVDDEHHTWCNYFALRSVEDCPMCERLRTQYPDDGKTPQELQEEHFPNVVPLTRPEQDRAAQSRIQCRGGARNGTHRRGAADIDTLAEIKF